MLDQTLAPLSLDAATADTAGAVDHSAALPPEPPEPPEPPLPPTPPAPPAAEKLIAHQIVYSGVWTASGAGQYLRLDRNYNDFLASYGELYGKGYKVGSLTSYVRGGVVHYGATFDPNPAGQYLRLDRDLAGMESEYGVMWNLGYRLGAIDSYVKGGKLFFNATFNPGSAGQYLRLHRTFDQFLAEYGDLYGKNFKLAALTSYVLDGKVFYSAAYNPNSGGQYLRLDRTADAFRTEFTWMMNNGFRLAVFDTYVYKGQTYYNAAYNPGTAGQHVGLDLAGPLLSKEYGDWWPKNRRLLALTADKVEGLSKAKLAQKISSGLAPHVVGFAAMVGGGIGQAGSDEGLRRTSADEPVRYASVWARTNVASVSKTITAAATIRAVGEQGLPLTTLIHPYLPADWSRGSNVKTITFQDLLAHSSGFRNPNGYGVGWDGLKSLVADGIKLADKTPSYQNHNYALLRVLLPYLRGFNGGGDRDLGTAKAFLAYVNQSVLGPCGIPAVDFKPVPTEPTLCYPFPAGNVSGTHWGDQTRECGGSGIQINASELVTFLTHLMDKDTILDATQRETMRTLQLGWWNSTAVVRHGSVLGQNGYLWMPTANGKAEVNTLVLSFSTGVHVGLIINSRVGDGVDYYQVAIGAYNNAWSVTG